MVAVIPARKPVYPRWRGEYNIFITELQNIGGLSPLARGIHTNGTLAPLRLRFIPAGAGNTLMFI